jgi:MFS transporter, DHA3 family, macrolide efflux protein
MLSGNGASYGLMVSAYGVGSLVTSLALGNFSIQRQTALMFTGKIILGAGFLLMISTTNLLVVLAGAALAGLGGPFFDIMISLIIQSHLPADQIGKISSVRFLMEDAGNFFGLLIGVPLFAILSIPLGIGLCALIIFATGLFGLLCFGLRESFLSLPSGD